MGKLWLIPLLLMCLDISQAASISCRDAFNGLDRQSLRPASLLSQVPEVEIENRIGKRAHELIGMSRGPEGNLIPLFGEMDFKSVRQLEGEPIREGWNVNRSMKRIPLKFVLKTTTLVKGDSFRSLPAEFLKMLSEGYVPMTASGSVSNFSILMATAPSRWDKTGGRTGILLQNNLPVVLRDPHTGKEFLVELKGIGRPEGDFAKDDNWTIQGGEVGIAAVREHENIELLKRDPVNQIGDAVQSGGYMLFDGGFGQQGIGIRLTPGNIRATFQDNSAFQRGPQLPTLAAQAMGRFWGQFLRRGMIPMSHPENLVANADFTQFYGTDFSDILHVARLPSRWGHSTREPMPTLESSIRAVFEIPGLDPVTGFSSYLKGLLPELKKNPNFKPGDEQKLLQAQNAKEAAQVIWSSIMAPATFEFRLRYGSVPFELSNYRLEDMDSSAEEYRNKILANTKYNISRLKQELVRQGPEVDQELARVGKKSDYFMYAYHNVMMTRDLLPYLNRFLNGELSLDDLRMRYSHPIPGLEPRAQELANMVLDNLTGNTGRIWSGLIYHLKKHADFLRQLSPANHIAQENLEKAEKRIIYLQELGSDGFCRRYCGDKQAVVDLFFLPYQTANLRHNPFMARQEEFRLNAQEIRNLYLQ